MIHVRTKLGMRKVAFLISLGAIFIAANFSSSVADLFFSPDIPISIDNDSFGEGNVIRYRSADFSVYLSGLMQAIPIGVNVDAFDFSENGTLFSVDMPVTINGESYTESDLILYDCNSFSKHMDGSTLGIPRGANMGALSMLEDESIVFSLDIPSVLEGDTYRANDLIRYDGSSFDLYLDGSGNGIPEGVHIDGVHMNSDGDLLLSLEQAPIY